jgi:hypothetical protein
MSYEILNGVYKGSDVWVGDLDLQQHQGPLISLGPLKEVTGTLYLRGCSNLTSLGSLTKVGCALDIEGCTNLVSLGSLTKAGVYSVTGGVYLRDCTSLTSLGSLEEVGNWLGIAGCTNLISLGSLTKVRGRLSLSLKRQAVPLQEVQEKIHYYSHLPLHEALNALHTDEVQEVPLYKNILLQTLQGG